MSKLNSHQLKINAKCSKKANYFNEKSFVNVHPLVSYEKKVLLVFCIMYAICIFFTMQT